MAVLNHCLPPHPLGAESRLLWSQPYTCCILQVIRHYHGHLSGVYSLALHPNLDLLMTGGRDSVCRVWDMRSKVQAHVLSGHDDTVCSILSQASDPQVTFCCVMPQQEGGWGEA